YRRWSPPGHSRRRFVTWQIHAECRADSELAFDLDMSAALFDNAVHGRQTESRTLAKFFGCEERLECPGSSFFVHASAGIADLKHRVLAGTDVLVGRFVESCVGGSEHKRAAVRHGVASVEHEVHQDLLDL